MKPIEEMTIEELEISCGLVEVDEDVDEDNLRCWIDCANESINDFPIQNLPFGVFSRKETPNDHTIGVAIGDRIIDLKRAIKTKLLCDLPPEVQQALSKSTLNAFMAMGPKIWENTRYLLQRLMNEKSSILRDNEELRYMIMVPMTDVDMHLPFKIGDYTDFYTSENHARNVGKRFRPNNPLMPNFKHLPVAYHGRASSVVVSGTDIVRPKGQILESGAEAPVYKPSELLDYEIELGAVVGAGNPLGQPIAMADVADHLFGMVIINDWSARDVQKWEYQPLGPFNGKNFATSISPWVVTLEALKPYRVPGPPRKEGDPETLDYLKSEEDWALDITVEVYLSSEKMREQKMAPLLLSKGNFEGMYWTIAQMLVHHTSSGANLRTGDLLGSGTISGETDDSKGSLLEIVEPGSKGIELPDGTMRRALQDGDEVILRAYAYKEGKPRIGFGECRGIVVQPR